MTNVLSNAFILLKKIDIKFIKTFISIKNFIKIIYKISIVVTIFKKKLIFSN